MHHLAFGSPTQATFLKAIEKGWLTGFPNLILENAKQHCTKKSQTTLGHQKLIRQNTRSTKDPTPRTNCHRLGIGAVTDKELRNLVCMDQLGRYPITSACALAANKSLYSALIAGAVYDQKLEKWMRHKDLINHPDAETR